MAHVVNFMRAGKGLAIGKMRDEARRAALVAIASTGNLASSDKYRVRYGLQEVGASVDFTKNSLKLKSLQQLAPKGEALAPLLRGKTLIACGPAEVPMAKQLLALEKQLPDFFVVGALLHQKRVLQASELERLSKLPPTEQVHTEMVAQILPGMALQVPPVGLFLLQTLQAHVDQLKAAESGGEPP